MNVENETGKNKDENVGISLSDGKFETRGGDIWVASRVCCRNRVFMRNTELTLVEMKLHAGIVVNVGQYHNYWIVRSFVVFDSSTEEHFAIFFQPENQAILHAFFRLFIYLF